MQEDMQVDQRSGAAEAHPEAPARVAEATRNPLPPDAYDWLGKTHVNEVYGHPPLPRTS